MDANRPIRTWDYLAVGNIVPAVGGSRIAAACAVCRQDAWIDPKGALYTAPRVCEIVCDPCGDRHAPDSMALVRQLRACDRLTAAVGGADPDADPWALMCPVCYREQAPEERIDDGCWRVVDAEFGRQVCSDCLPKIDGALVRLTKSLEDLERRHRLFDSADPEVMH